MSTHGDYSKYFPPRQKVFLINISEGRDQEHFESLSGVIVTCNRDAITLQVPYATDLPCPEKGGNPVTYKIATESMGSGVQIMADLVKIADGNVYHLQLRGPLEMYQRRATPRVDTTLKIFQIRRDATLAVYRKEFKRVMDGMRTLGVRPKLALKETGVNLSMGGLRILADPGETVYPLAMFFLDLDASQPLVCAVAELIWMQRKDDLQACGYRFMQISKVDQERINKYVLSLRAEQGLPVPAARTHWELLDRMSNP
jgi:hypothetical protein